MDKQPINQITSIKSLQQLKEYLERHTKDLNLSLLMDKGNSTLLHFSAFKNDLQRMKIFIKHFKQFTEINHGLSTAVGSSFADKLRAWVNSPNKEGYVPLLYAGLHGNLQMIQFLEECGANMQYRTTKNENILFMSVQHNRIKALIYLLESNNKYNLNLTNFNGDTILHQACSKGYSQIVSYLITVGSDLEAINNDGETPLMIATKQSKKQIVKLLLIKGANREIKNKNNETAIDIARSNNKQELVKILDNNYGLWDKFKIKCNKKIIYEPEKSSYMFSIYFIILFHLFFLPANVLSQFVTDEKYIVFIPFIFEGLYELVMMGLYLSLLRKQKKKKPIPLMQIDGNFCAQCKRKTSDKIFHCYICQRCIHRYDHHCPWINGCVGSHNVGRFTLFLFVMLIGLAEVTFCSVCLLIDNEQFFRYRKMIQIPDIAHQILNIMTILFSSLLGLGIFKLLIQQLRNLMSNSTGIERQRKERSLLKKPELLASQASLNQSVNNQNYDEDEIQTSSNCFTNCCNMLSESY